MTICFHVDDVKCSHEEPAAVDDFLQWVKEKYGSIGEVKITRGKLHEYLGMTLDFAKKGKARIDMVNYVKSMLEDSPE